MKSRLVKILVSVPIEFSNDMRKAMGKAIGALGNYDFTSLSYPCTGRFRPLEGSNPTIGKIGEIAVVKEERIETIAERKNLKSVLSAIRSAHPYEYPIIDVFAIEDVYEDM